MYNMPANVESIKPKITMSILFGETLVNGGTALVNKTGCSTFASPAESIFCVS